MIYDHTQRSWWIAAVLGLAVVGLVLLAVVTDMALWLRIVLGLAALAYVWLMLTFSRLRVRIDDGSLVVSFGFGWPRRRIALDRIAAVSARRARWWYGWGIRRIPGGWLWNVSGLGYVEFRLPDSTFNVGTDEPDTLVAAVSPWIRRSRR